MRFQLALLTLTLISFSALAKKGEFIRQSDSDYKVTEEMIKDMINEGKSFYSVDLLNKEEFLKPERKAFQDLDYMAQDKLENTSYLVSKHVYMLNRPADFFSCELLGDIKYLKALEREKPSRAGTLNYVMSGNKFFVYKYQFNLNWFADFPDCQNMASEGTSVMNEDIAKLKTFDPGVTYPLHGTYLKDKPNFTQFLHSGWIFAKIHRVAHETGEKTLMITYEVTAMPSEFALKKMVENGHIKVMQREDKANSKFKLERIPK